MSDLPAYRQLLLYLSGLAKDFFLFLTMTEYDNVKIKSGASYLCHLHRTGNMNSSLDSDADMVPELLSIIKTTT